MGLALKDSPPGFDPSTVIGSYGDEGYGDGTDGGDAGFAETEQY
jgi:DNA-directed RNA polymerase subunit alpha